MRFRAPYGSDKQSTQSRNITVITWWEAWSFFPGSRFCWPASAPCGCTTATVPVGRTYFFRWFGPASNGFPEKSRQSCHLHITYAYRLCVCTHLAGTLQGPSTSPRASLPEIQWWGAEVPGHSQLTQNLIEFLLKKTHTCYHCFKSFCRSGSFVPPPLVTHVVNKVFAKV